MSRTYHVVNVDWYRQSMSSLAAAEAAAYLGVSQKTLYAYVSRGLIVSEPTEGKTRRYPLWALDELKARRAERREPAAAALRWGTPVLESSLTLIDRGRLCYRGHDAVELSRSATLEEVACLLWTSSMEGASRPFPPVTPANTGGPRIERLVAALIERRTRYSFSLVEPTPATLLAAEEIVAALFAAAGARGTGTLAQRLARGWRSPSADDLQAALILCADHGLSASAFTARIVAATDAPLPNAVLAALLALEGRRHGGTSRDVVDFLDEVDRIGPKKACDRALASRGRILGLSSHALYPDGDPRADELLRRIWLPPDDPAAKAIAYTTKLSGSPSIELALAALARSRKLPADAAFVLFALGRSVGWIAHAFEAANGPLIRPRARYVGPPPL